MGNAFGVAHTLRSQKEMKLIPKTFEGIERFVMVSILSILGTLVAFSLFEHRAVQSLTTSQMNETEERIAAYSLIGFVVFCLIRATFLLLKKRKNSWLYALGIPLGGLTLIHLGAVIH